jgi:predicted DCC family thiol-disulfide oxidoreductase YuxK
MKHKDRRLPDPDHRPEADVVVYDGSCPLCRGTADWLARLDGRGRLAFLPLQDARVPQRYPDLSPKDLQQHVYVISREGRRRKGAEAIRYLSRRIPALWAMAPLLHLPGTMPLWRWLYQQVARRRHALDRNGQ